MADIQNMKPYYQDDSVTIYNGDCRDVIPTIGKVGLVLTDPPYGENTHKQAKSNKGYGTDKMLVHFDSISKEDLGSILSECSKICDRWIVGTMEWRHIFHFDDTPPNGLRFMRFGVWVKSNGMPQISADRPAQGWEGIAYLHNENGKPSWHGGGKSGNYVLPIAPSEHPTAKPIGIFLSLIERFSNPGDIVFDPFMGGGVTIRAAKDLGRKSIGCDLDEKYCEMAARRCQQEVLPL